jgi:diguanylate cyclase (GGDEF)-like protein
MNIENPEMHRDQLTGLFNRKYGLTELGNSLENAATVNGSVVILLTDLDSYRLHNHNYGHGIGDRLLQEISERVLPVVGDQGVISRTAGDEFLIILPMISIAAAKVIAEKIRKEIEQIKIQVDEQIVKSVTITIGVACYPEHGKDVNTLLQAADAAILKGKQLKGNIVCEASEIV